jgi:hypothetical protein
MTDAHVMLITGATDGLVRALADRLAAPIEWDDVMIERNHTGTRGYAQIKLAQITSGFTLARRIPADIVTVKIVLQEIGHTCLRPRRAAKAVGTQPRTHRCAGRAGYLTTR